MTSQALENSAIRSAFFSIANPLEFPRWEPNLNQELALELAGRIWTADDRAPHVPWRPHFNIIIGGDNRQDTDRGLLADAHHKTYNLCLGIDDFSLVNQRSINTAFAREVQLTLDYIDSQATSSGVFAKLSSAYRNSYNNNSERMKQALAIGRNFSMLAVIELV